MNPRQFLIVGGVILLVVGVLGFLDILIGPNSSIFGTWWYFDTAENWAHTVLGIVALLAAFVLPGSLQKPLVMVVGVLGILVALWSIIGPVPEGKVLLGAMLQNPMDTILHLVVGAWALWASMQKEEAAMAM